MIDAQRWESGNPQCVDGLVYKATFNIVGLYRIINRLSPLMENGEPDFFSIIRIDAVPKTEPWRLS